MKLLALTACLLLFGCSEQPKKDVIPPPPPPPDPPPCVYDAEPNDTIEEAVYVGGFLFVPQDLCGELEDITDVDVFWFGHQTPLLANFDIIADGPFQAFIIVGENQDVFFSTMEGDLWIEKWPIEPEPEGFYLMLAPLADTTKYDFEYWQS